MNKKAEFAARVLKQYALESQTLVRSTSDLSPMEQWLISRLHAAGTDHPSDAISNAKRRNEIKKILYRNSTDDSECMRIRFEDIENITDLLNGLYN